MTRIERQNFFNTMVLGATLTLLVVASGEFRTLDTVERELYDLRARFCQFFVPSPTDRIVHLDIDDETLSEIGSFPWARTKLAEMTDEIHRAGAKVISFDVLLSEPQDVRYLPHDDGSFARISDDDAFADAIKRAGNVLLPVSLDLDAAHQSSLETQVIKLLSSDLELSNPQLLDRLHGGHFDGPQLKESLADIIVSARNTAFFNRINEGMDHGVTDLPGLTALLTPRANASQQHTDARVVLERMYPIAQSIRVILSRCVPTPAGAPPMLSAETENAVSIPVLTKAAHFSASALFLTDPDGIVRRCPLLVNYRGHLLPQMSLVNACALLGVDTKSIRISPTDVILPLPEGGQISIPVSTVRSQTFGTVGLFMNIPWYGKSDWKTMYDGPRYTESKQHLPLKVVWAICQNLHDIQRNYELADAALLYASKVYPALDKAAALLAKPAGQRGVQERWDAVDDALDTMGSVADIPALEKLDPSQLRPDDQFFLSAYQALHHVKATNATLDAEIGDRRAALQEQLKGRAVLVGWTATGRIDIWRTPIHPLCPGCAIQGEIFNAILTRTFLRDAPVWVTSLITLSIGLVVTLAVAGLSTEMATVSTLLIILAYAAVNGILLFARYHWIVGAASPLLAALVCHFALTLIRFLVETAERKRIEGRFRSYVDPKLVNYVKEHPESVHLSGQVKEMTVVFTDLQGFTTIAEKLRERTVPMLNQYMSLMMPVIRDNGGTWNKFLGDGIMFFFNAPYDNPNHSRDAVNTVIQMQKAMVGFNEQLTAQDLPTCTMRAGLSTGSMVVGDAGSIYGVHRASDYTVLGDDVNLSARLESANKAFGTKILMNERTANSCGNDFLIRPVGLLRVVGKTEGVMAYEALARSDEATEDQRATATLSAAMVQNYRWAKFDMSLEYTNDLESRFGPGKFSKLYRKLCEHNIEHPPEGEFDPTISLDVK